MGGEPINGKGTGEDVKGGRGDIMNNGKTGLSL